LQVCGKVRGSIICGARWPLMVWDPKAAVSECRHTQFRKCKCLSGPGVSELLGDIALQIHGFDR
jgi:hypothetical protein